jgi:hypothetical protein
MPQSVPNDSTVEFDIEKTIFSHSSWMGELTGLASEVFLKRQKPYTYLLRVGEKNSHYYLSFVDQHLVIRHQPFAIIYTKKSWYCQQGDGYGPFITETIDDLIHRIMHCKPEDCNPVLK